MIAITQPIFQKLWNSKSAISMMLKLNEDEETALFSILEWGANYGLERARFEISRVPSYGHMYTVRRFEELVASKRLTPSMCSAYYAFEWGVTRSRLEWDGRSTLVTQIGETTHVMCFSAMPPSEKLPE